MCIRREMNAKVGEEETRNCSKCKMKTKQVFVKKGSGIWKVRWGWECTRK